MQLQLHYTDYTTPQLQLHYATTTTTAALHHTTSSSCGWGDRPGDHSNHSSHSQKRDSNHLSDLSYRFPILKLPPQTCAVLLEYEVQCRVYVTYSKVGEGHVTFCPCVLCCVLVHWKQTNIIKTYMYCRWYPYIIYIYICIIYIYIHILAFEPRITHRPRGLPGLQHWWFPVVKEKLQKILRTVYAVFSAFGCRVFRVLGFRALGF